MTFDPFYRRVHGSHFCTQPRGLGVLVAEGPWVSEALMFSPVCALYWCLHHWDCFHDTDRAVFSAGDIEWINQHMNVTPFFLSRLWTDMAVGEGRTSMGPHISWPTVCFFAFSLASFPSSHQAVELGDCPGCPGHLGSINSFLCIGIFLVNHLAPISLQYWLLT